MNADNIEINIFGPNPSKELRMTIPWDSGIDDWITVFKTILINQTFSEDSVKEAFYDEFSTPTLPEGKVYLTSDED